MPLSEAIKAENRSLCEAAGSGKTLAVREVCMNAGSLIEQLSKQIAAVEGKVPAGMYRAQVGNWKKTTANGRLYNKDVWQDQVTRLGPQLADGYLMGAVDHVGRFDSGNLRDSCVIHRSLEVDAAGPIYANYEIVEGHSRGKDLKSLHDAKAAIGWSTYGYGTAHSPSDQEREMYDLPEGSDTVIMDRNYELKQIDAVGDPASKGARTSYEQVAPAGDILEASSPWENSVSHVDSEILNEAAEAFRPGAVAAEDADDPRHVEYLLGEAIDTADEEVAAAVKKMAAEVYG